MTDKTKLFLIHAQPNERITFFYCVICKQDTINNIGLNEKRRITQCEDFLAFRLSEQEKFLLIQTLLLKKELRKLAVLTKAMEALKKEEIPQIKIITHTHRIKKLKIFFKKDQSNEHSL